ncbi:MAG: 5-formyltetrahydrofolate cyclo-ligase [Nitrospinota bacterium]
MTVQPQDVPRDDSFGPGPAAEKVRIRRTFLTRRDALSPQTVEALSRSILARFWRLRAVRDLDARVRDGRPAWLSSYVDFGREVRTRPLLRRALARGYRVAVPVVPPGRRGVLILSEVNDVPDPRAPGPDWVRTGWGLLEPRELRPVEPERMDCFVIPGVAFDRSGYRIGFGRGYYDRLLAAARPDAWRIGLAFSSQMTPRLPWAEWDVPMHRVVTESGVVRCSSLEFECPTSG